jgi:hypothetical protein
VLDYQTMSNHGHIHQSIDEQLQHHDHLGHDSFLIWCIKRIPTAILSGMKTLIPVISVIGSLFVGVLIFLLGFKDDEHVQEILGGLQVFLVPLSIGLISFYFTFLPFIMALLMLIVSFFAPKKYVFMTVGCLMFLSFFNLFLI